MIGLRLKELRAVKKLRQSDIAAFLGISRTTYTQYETGVSEPDIDTINKLAEYYNVSTDYLLGRTDDRNYADTSINSDWPPEAKVLFRDVHKLTPEQRDIVLKLIKEFIGESK